MTELVNINPVAFADLIPEDLSFLARLDKISYDGTSAEEMLAGIAAERISFWRLSGPAQGALLLSLVPGALWIEGLAGNGLMACAQQIRDKLRDIAREHGRTKIQGTTHRPGLVRLYQKLGHRPVATIMEAEV